VIMRKVATNVQEAVVAGSGHWLMEERPAETVALIRSFLDSPQIAAIATADSTTSHLGEKRLTPASTSSHSKAIPPPGVPGLAELRLLYSRVIRIKRACTRSCCEFPRIHRLRRTPIAMIG
jgi:hypothetical protein